MEAKTFSEYLTTGGRGLNEGIDPKHAPNGEKRWHRMDNIGKAKYTINFHDGVKTHPDGSKFYDIRIFKNKPDMEAFIQELTQQGYKEGKSPLYEAAAMSKEISVSHGGKTYMVYMNQPKPGSDWYVSEVVPAVDEKDEELWGAITAKATAIASSKLNEGESTWQGNTLPGIRSVREDLGLEPGDTSKDKEIHAMSFKEYLGHYLAWEGIIGYTATIAGIAAVMADKLRK